MRSRPVAYRASSIDSPCGRPRSCRVRSRSRSSQERHRRQLVPWRCGSRRHGPPGDRGARAGRQCIVQQAVGAPNVVRRRPGHRHVEQHLHQVHEGDLLAAQPAREALIAPSWASSQVAALGPREVLRGQASHCLVSATASTWSSIGGAGSSARSLRAAAGRHPEVDVVGQVPARSAAPAPGSGVPPRPCRHPTGGAIDKARSASVPSGHRIYVRPEYAGERSETDDHRR